MSAYYRNPRAAERGRIAAEAAQTRDKRKRARLRKKALALLTVWERALYELHLHYADCMELYGCYARGFLDEFCRGAERGDTFRKACVRVLDIEDRYGPGVRAMVEIARSGKMAEHLAGSVDDRDLGALIGGAREA